MAKRQLRDYAFKPGLSGLGTLKVLDKVNADQILLISNATANQILYNFSDATNPISVSFQATTDGSDPDFPFANTLSNGVTTITFLFDTSAFNLSDEIQIFVEDEVVRTRPYDFGTDAIERQRVSNTLSMLDADFEYGIQPTKWQTIDLMRGYPSSFEFPGADVEVSAIVTDASQGSGGVGPSLITIDTLLDHGFSVGDPITLKGVDDGVTGFAKAEGSFIISAVPQADQFQFYAKGKVGTSPATSLFSGFIQLRKAGFYTGASLGSPQLTVASNGASGQFTTRGINTTGVNRIGIAVPGSAPPAGAPISGSNIAAGTQITGYVDTDTTIAITTSFTAPASQITLNETTDLEVGSALDDGSGNAIFVTNIEENTISLSSPYQADRTGNSFISSATSPSPVNFGKGSGAFVVLDRNSGAYENVAINPIVFHYEVQVSSYPGLGTNATFNVTQNAATGVYDDVFVSNIGSGYSATETIIIYGSAVGGDDTTHDISITINSVDANGGITGISATGTASSNNPNAGALYQVGEKVVIYGNQLGGISPANDLELILTGVDGTTGAIQTFKALGQGIPSNQDYLNVSGSTSGTGINASFGVQRTGSGVKTAQVDEVEIGGSVEVGDVFNIDLTDTSSSTVENFSFTAVANDGVNEIRNGLITAINDLSTGSAYVFAEAGGEGKVRITAISPGSAFTVAVSTFEGDASAADSQTITHTNFIPNENTSTSPTYSATIGNPGSGYAPNDTITLLGSGLGGNDIEHDLTITVTSVDASGSITAFTLGGTAASGDASFEALTPTSTAFGATFFPRITGGAYNPDIDNAGTGYQIGYQFTIGGEQLGGTSPANDMTITVTDVDFFNGAILAVSATGTPVSGDSIAFYPSVAISAPTTGNIANGATIVYAAIARIRAQFPNNHGLVPGNTILTAITSVGTGHDLAAGPFFVEEVPAPDEFVYTVRSTGTVSTSPALAGSIYARPDCFYTHRPFDGGVQLGTGSPSHSAQAIRQSKKYIRYQSGKGIMYTTGALFAPSYDLRQVTANGIAVGSIITVTTDDVDHGLQVGAEIALDGINTIGYNNHYIVASIIDEITFTVLAVETLGSTTPTFGEQPQVALYQWKGATVRSGAFDDQNGIFFQYDGTNLAVGLRSSTFQIAGTVSASPDSNAVTGVNSKFTEQLVVGDRIVIRGMTHVVTSIQTDTLMTVNPDFRGVVPVNNTKCALTKDIIIPQSQWNIDKCDGTGKSGYNIEINKMQMIGFQYSWYGAGFIDWMFRGPSGNFVFCHRLKNNNRNREAFMRSGNLPVRYEVINEGPKSFLTQQIDDVSIEHLDVGDVSLFPPTGVVYVGNELIRYSTKNNTTNRLLGLTRNANLTNYVAGANRTYTAGTPTQHAKNSGVILLSNTATPQINHWGSAFLTDGGFDSDRGYLFNYQATEVEISTVKETLFLIRLSPSVSNALTGDLGERELINRAQLLLKNCEITTQGGTSSQGVVVEGILNPINYPTNPADIEWFGLNTSGSGGQPSFAQIASGATTNWAGGGSTISATNSRNQNYWSNWVIFQRSAVQGVGVGMQVTGPYLPGGTTVTNIRSYSSSEVRIYFSQWTRAQTAGSSTYVFETPPYAQPGERVFSFVAAPGNRDQIDLSELKELTNTPIGGRGTFPNGPDVLAITVYATSGNPFNATVNLRWAEAQA